MRLTGKLTVPPDNTRTVAPADGVTGTRSPGAIIARAGVLLMVGTAASRILGLVRDIVVSARFGTSGDLDLYVAAFRVPDLVFTLVSGGALGSALVAVFSQALHGANSGNADDRTGEVRLVRVAGAVAYGVMVASTLVAAVGMVLAHLIAPLLGTGFSPDGQDRLAAMIRILLLQPVLLGTGEVLTRFLHVRGRFVVTAFAPAAYTGAIVVAALVAPVEMGTEALAWGTVAGAALFLVVQGLDAWHVGFRLPLAIRSLAGTRDDVAEVLRLMGPRLVGQGAVQLSFVATTRIASFLPAGSLAALNYAWALAMLPLGAFAMTTANAAFPTFAGQAARGEFAALASTGRRVIGAISVAMLPAVAGAFAIGPDAIEVLFGRHAFGPESVHLTATALAAYAAGLPAHGILEVQMRLSFALRDMRTPVVIGVVAMALNVALATALAPGLGHVGIGIALSAAAFIEVVLLGAMLERRLPGVHGDGLGGLLARLGAVAVVAGVAAWGTSTIAREFGIPVGARLLLDCAAFGVSALGAAWALGAREILDTALALARRLGWRRPPLP